MATIMLRKIIPFRNIYNEFAVLISINDNNSEIIIYFITIFHNNITNIIYFCIFLVAKHFFFLSNIWYPISSVINWEAIFNFYTSSCKIEFKTSIFTFFILNIFLCNISYIYSGVPEFIWFFLWGVEKIDNGNIKASDYMKVTSRILIDKYEWDQRDTYNSGRNN